MAEKKAPAKKAAPKAAAPKKNVVQPMQLQVYNLLKKETNEVLKKRFCDYVGKVYNDPKNSSWAKAKPASYYADKYFEVKAEGLEFDGKHVTFLSRGVSYDYVAYKNKMLVAYPESKINMGVVYKDDIFTSSTVDGKVNYTHENVNAFGEKVDADIVGTYCVIKNQRGEFITLLNAAEINKHKAVAKTDMFWNKWFKEMVLKTVIKKACSQHYEDKFKNIVDQDNEANIDLPTIEEMEKQQELENKAVAKTLKEIDSKKFKDVEALETYYLGLPKTVKVKETIIEKFREKKAKLQNT